MNAIQGLNTIQCFIQDFQMGKGREKCLSNGQNTKGLLSLAKGSGEFIPPEHLASYYSYFLHDLKVS